MTESLRSPSAVVMRRTGFFALTFLSLGVAGYAVFVYGFLPLGRALHPDMRATFEASRLGFGALAVAWLYTGLRAYLAIRARDVTAHRRWMVRNFSLTFAAVTLRLWLPASVVTGIPFAIAYPVIAWLCWVPNLVLAELLFNQMRNPSIEGADRGLRHFSAPHVRR
jgi:hypothetical protein